MRTIAIANHKSGVGKTATTHALGALLAERGRRVLLLDLNPQADLTAFCGIESAAGVSLAEVLGGTLPGIVPLRDILREVLPGLYLFLAPSDLALAPSELGLLSRMGREEALKHILQTVSEDFDLALIDCPSNLGLLTLNALTAASAVLIPTQPQIPDLRALWFFLATVEQVRHELNRNLETLGILVTSYDWRLSHHRAAVEAMVSARLPILPVGLGRSTRVSASVMADEQTLTYLPTNREAQAELADLIERWLDGGGASSGRAPGRAGASNRAEGPSQA
ncbi:MAG: AAA family ATPase [Anaerolineales bacterium]|nr:AAA family ATPase [Anaerolineales bacterium]